MMRVFSIKGQKAALLLEMVVVLPLFILLACVILDLGIILRSQIYATRIAYEGTRLASDSSRLPIGSFTFTNENGDAGADEEHIKLRDKILKIAQAYNIQGNILQISTSRLALNKTVSVQLTLRPPLYFFGNTAYSVKGISDGPYLFINDEESASYIY